MRERPPFAAGSGGRDLAHRIHDKGANANDDRESPGARHRAPYHQWLGLKVIAVHDDGIELKATWREEWVVNPERRYTHGGVLAALVDLGADWAMVKKLGRGVPTIDLRVDYHAAAMPGDLTVQRQGRAHGRPVLDRRGAGLRRAGQAAGERPRHLFHRAAAR